MTSLSVLLLLSTFCLFFHTCTKKNQKKMPPGSIDETNNTLSSFEAFFQGWLLRQELLLNELIIAQNTLNESSQETDIRNLIAHVLAHYQEYYEEKSRMSHGNIFHVFSPRWFSPLEKSFLWIAGFKPGLAFSLVMNSVDDLSADQIERINRLKFETKAREKTLTHELAKIQESVAAPPLVGLAQQFGAYGLQEREIREEVDENMEPLRSAMENVVTDADRLRTRTADRVVGILSPSQSLRFLKAAAELQLRIRMLGRQIEAERLQMGTCDG